MGEYTNCPNCQAENSTERYFCRQCGTFLAQEFFGDKERYKDSEKKVMRILENLKKVPHKKIVWNDTIDLYTEKVEKYRQIMKLPELAKGQSDDFAEEMMSFLDLCYKPDFQIAFVGVIKTGKSTLINALLGHNYASMAVTPETAALTKFRSSPEDYIKVTFYSEKEWKALWKSINYSEAGDFLKEYERLDAEKEKNNWVGHETIEEKVANEDLEKKLEKWSSSKHPEHYFVKEIEVGISSLPKNFPKQIVFVDTPGLSDPVAYRSEITRQYISKANAVFVCVDAQKIQKEEIETISSVFSFSSHNKSKVHIIATHWGKLNSPERDWKEQKAYLVDRLVGEGFFGKNAEELARKNIMHSEAHIFNLCRDFKQIQPQTDEWRDLMSFAILMGVDVFGGDLEEHIKELQGYTNIEKIQTVINEELAKNYENLLMEDIEVKYIDILKTLKRMAADNKKEVSKIIKVSRSDMEEMQKQIEEQKKKYEEVKQCKEQLEGILTSVRQNTKQRLNSILPRLGVKG